MPFHTILKKRRKRQRSVSLNCVGFLLVKVAVTSYIYNILHLSLIVSQLYFTVLAQCCWYQCCSLSLHTKLKLSDPLPVSLTWVWCLLCSTLYIYIIFLNTNHHKPFFFMKSFCRDIMIFLADLLKQLFTLTENRK